jgi:hypothetical protein
VSASAGGSVSLDGGNVSTTGTGAAGFGVSAGTIPATNIVAQTSGASAPAGTVSNGGSLTLNGGSVTTLGAGSVGFLVTGPAVTANTLQLSNTPVSSAADAFNVQGGTGNISINGASVTSNNGVLLNTLASGTTAMTATAAQLTGAVITDSASGSSANVTLQNNTSWAMTGSSNMSNLVNDGSTITFAAPTGDPTQLASYKTLSTINYTGTNGNIVLNTYFGTDGSPSDQIIINAGQAAGITQLVFHNTNGPGQITAGQLVIGTSALNGGTTGVLVTMPLPTPAFVVSGRQAVLQGVPLSANAIAAGTAVLAEIRDNAGAVVVSGLTVGTSAADIIIGSTGIAVNETVTCSGGTITHP